MYLTNISTYIFYHQYFLKYVFFMYQSFLEDFVFKE